MAYIFEFISSIYCFDDFLYERLFTDPSFSDFFETLLGDSFYEFSDSLADFFSDYLNSFCYFHNLSFFNKEVSLCQRMNINFLKKKTGFFLIFFHKYSLNFYRFFKGVNLTQITLLLFIVKFLEKRDFFLVYLNTLIDEYSIINVVYSNIISCLSVKNKITVVPITFSTKYISNTVLLEKKNYFDLYEFNTNFFDRKSYSYDVCPFILCFFRNFRKKKTFYYYSRLFFFWFEISIY